MQMFYSPSTNGFYCEVIHGDRMPEDVRAISTEVYETVVGKSYAPNSQGLPELIAPVATPYVPSVITMRQARLALLGAGKLNGVDAAIAALPSPQREAAKIEWEFAASVERRSPIVALLSTSMGLSDEVLDALFTTAATL
ncbi:hypothetical protein [Variovorax sp. V15]|uniref:hypothetical protein n=1 Tax=Variovorax sp. V15 TaxID=3065952 RepID=UPI0034E8DCA4